MRILISLTFVALIVGCTINHNIVVGTGAKDGDQVPQQQIVQAIQSQGQQIQSLNKDLADLKKQMGNGHIQERKDAKK